MPTAKIEPASPEQCTRCGALVLAAWAGGCRAHADPLPLDLDAYRAALIEGRRTYTVQRAAPGVIYLLDRTAGSRLDVEIVRQHRCAPGPVESHPINTPGPPSAHAKPGSSAAGSRPSPVPALHGPTTPDTAKRATRPRSDSGGSYSGKPHQNGIEQAFVVCHECHARYRAGEPRFIVVVGPQAWTAHVRCARKAAAR